MTGIRFDDDDLQNTLPAPGYYKAKISTARFRNSTSGNGMLHIVYVLEGIAPGYERVAEYFVLEGPTAQAIAVAKRNLVDLYRACGLEPQAGDEISPADLFGATLEVRVTHDEWQGKTRLRIVGHRRMGSVPF